MNKKIVDNVKKDFRFLNSCLSALIINNKIHIKRFKIIDILVKNLNF